MTEDADDVIPISRLFFDDAGPHIVRSGTPAAGAVRHTPARGRELQDLLGTSIAQLGAVSGGTRKTPTPAPVVAIETLLYSGRAALERALELRAATRSTGQALSPEEIEELLDLIALAAEE